MATDRGLFATLLHAPDFGMVWFEMGVSPMVVSVDRGLHWLQCTSALCPSLPTAPFAAATAAPFAGLADDAGPLPITVQTNRTHPNVRSVISVGNGGVLVTLYDEGWYPSAAPCTYTCTATHGTPLHDTVLRYTAWCSALLTCMRTVSYLETGTPWVHIVTFHPRRIDTIVTPPTSKAMLSLTQASPTTGAAPTSARTAAPHSNLCSAAVVAGCHCFRMRRCVAKANPRST